MMNKRGISMISLIIIIIVTIILIGVATTAGYRYLEEANQLKAKSLGSLVGMSAGRRQNDLSSGIANNYYEGYYVDINSLIENKDAIRYFPEGKQKTLS